MPGASFGQVVIGPPGCGKTTYCEEMGKLLQEVGRKVAIINIDPANQCKVNIPTIDILELITLEDVMDNMNLGPNGALIYCMEFLEKNLSWLEKKMSNLSSHYFLLDCPGQVELYTHHSSLRNIFECLKTKCSLNLCVVQLIDSHYCNSDGKFIATVLMALSTMLHLEMPHINVLSKIDIAERFKDKLQFNLNFYTEVLDMSYFIHSLEDDALTRRYSKLNKAIISLVEDYSLVSFIPLTVTQRSSLLKVQKQADKANGYIFGSSEERNIQAMLACAVGVEYEDESMRLFCEKSNSEKATNLSESLLWE